MKSLSYLRTALSLAVFVGLVLSGATASAWTGATASPPSANTAAPLNVSSTDQSKAGWIGLNSLSIFNHLIISGVANSPNTIRYLNFGNTWDAAGYGIRDNAGTLEFRNAGGAWTSIQSSIYNYCTGGGCGAASQWTTAGSGIYYNGITGVGTTDQTNAKFEVNGTGSPDYAIFSDFTSATLRIGTSGGGTVRLRSDGAQNIALMPGGNFGVGTVSPSTKLDVTTSWGAAGSPPSQIAIHSGDIAGIGFVAGGYPNANPWMLYAYSAADGRFCMGKNGVSEPFCITGSGNVNITGGVSATGNVVAGSATLATNGDLYMPWAGQWLSTVLSQKQVSDGRAWNWSGQGGQPTWLWGSNDGTNMYVWNPSNFSVNYANSAGSAGSVPWSGITGKPFNWSGQGGQPTWLWGSNDGANYYIWNPSNFNVASVGGYGSEGLLKYDTWGRGSTYYASNGDSYLAWKGQWLSTALSQLALPANNTTWDTWYGSSYLSSNGNIYLGWRGQWLSTVLDNLPGRLGGQFWVYYTYNYGNPYADYNVTMCPSGSVAVGGNMVDYASWGPPYMINFLCQWITQ